MKPALLFILAFIIQKSDGFVGTFFKITTIGGDKIIAVGEKGTIVRSTDAGKNWAYSAHAGKTRNDLYSVAFRDGNHGWAVGKEGTILKTDDGAE